MVDLRSASRQRYDLECQGLLINSRYRPLPVVAFPFCVFIALVAQTNPQAPVLDSEVQMEILRASFQTHPPMIVCHSLQKRKRLLPQFRRERAFHPAIDPVSESPTNCRPSPKSCCHHKMGSARRAWRYAVCVRQRTKAAATYQRLRPKPPPLGRSPLGRSVLGRASLTFNVLPSSSQPFKHRSRSKKRSPGNAGSW